MAAITSVRSNAMPAGGTTASQPVTPNVTPADIADLVEQLTPTIAKFRASSSPMSVSLNPLTLGVNVSGQANMASSQISSVGLGTRLISEHSVTIFIANTSGGTLTFAVNPWFPYTLIQNQQVQINGGATVYSAGGPAGLFVATRNRQSTWIFSTTGGFGPALSPALVRVAVTGTGVTVTNSAATAPSCSGIASIAVTTSNTATITCTFYTFEKLCLDRESLLGALPLQNNSTFATVQRQLNTTIVSTTVAGGSFQVASLTGVQTTCTDVVNTTYEFWSIPSDATLYQEMVQNSYQVQEATGLSVTSAGPGALSYNIPQNMYLLAAHLYGYDGAGNPLTAAAVSRRLLQYNAGSVIPVQLFQGRQRASQFLDYQDDREMIAGYPFFWDGEDTTDSINDTDQAGWVDTYAAATPQLLADIAAGTAVPISYSLTRESVVAGAVQVVGG
jgi:hypothetical protein